MRSIMYNMLTYMLGERTELGKESRNMCQSVCVHENEHLCLYMSSVKVCRTMQLCVCVCVCVCVLCV